MRRAAFAAGLLALAFTGFSLVVASGALHRLDLGVSAAFDRLYVPSLLIGFRGLALLGGAELTMLLGLALFIYLWRQGYRLGAWAAAALPIASLVELVDKHTINHPSPPAALAHLDGPSLTDWLEGPAGAGWSFPSGHMTRAVVIYGLLAFVAARLSRRPLVRRLAAPATVLLLSAVAFDRLYLEVHWLSDVVGGLLLGATFLAASITWLEWSEARSE